MADFPDSGVSFPNVAANYPKFTSPVIERWNELSGEANPEAEKGAEMQFIMLDPIKLLGEINGMAMHLARKRELPAGDRAAALDVARQSIMDQLAIKREYGIDDE